MEIGTTQSSRLFIFAISIAEFAMLFTELAPFGKSGWTNWDHKKGASFLCDTCPILLRTLAIVHRPPIWWWSRELNFDRKGWWMDLGRRDSQIIRRHTRQNPCILNHSLEINFGWNTFLLHSYALLYSSSFVCFLYVMYHLQNQFFVPRKTALFHMTLFKCHALIDVIVLPLTRLLGWSFQFVFQKRLQISTKEIKRRSKLPNQMRVMFHSMKSCHS